MFFNYNVGALTLFLGQDSLALIGIHWAEMGDWVCPRILESGIKLGTLTRGLSALTKLDVFM